MSILYRLLILVFLAFSFNDCFSQSLNAISISADKYPVISARINVLDANNNLIKTLTKENFKVIEKGSPCPVVNFECPPIQHPGYFSTVLGHTDYLVEYTVDYDSLIAENNEAAFYLWIISFSFVNRFWVRSPIFSGF